MVGSLSCVAWEFVFWALRLFSFALLAYALVSWIPSLQGRWSSYIARIVEPVLAPVRRVIPPMGGFDISFIVTLVIVQYLAGSIPQIAAVTGSYCWIH